MDFALCRTDVISRKYNQPEPLKGGTLAYKHVKEI